MILHDNERVAVIEQLKETQTHLYQSRREYRLVCQRGGKGGKQIERCVISTFQVAESMGFKGEFRGTCCALAIENCGRC
jgi:hypothetical protein